MKKIELFETSDGKRFNSEAEAKAYEDGLNANLESKKDELLDKYKELVEMFKGYTMKSLTDHTYTDSETTLDNIGNLWDAHGQESDPCRYCVNNPKVNKYASGICHCILGNRIVY